MSDYVQEPFLGLIPKQGWLADYIEYTMLSEAPAAFHFFTGCAVLGAAIGRKVWFAKGYYRVFPNHQIILVAPTGKCRKTSALNLGLKLLQQLDGLNILADKTTPEALTAELSTLGMGTGGKLYTAREAHGVVYAPELAVFLGKQRYNEGMISLLTALFDNPDKWLGSTKGAGKQELTNVCITFMGASTPDWLVSAIPQDAFGGGFMSRLLFIVQEDTPRCFPIPKAVTTPIELIRGLQHRHKATVGGEMTFEDSKAEFWYSMWYTASRKDIPEDDKMAGYHERKPDHLLRLAMVLALSERRLKVTEADLVMSSQLLSYIESQMLNTFKWLGIRPIGVDQERILRAMRSYGKPIQSGDLLRKMIYYMNYQTFKLAMDTLREAGLIKETVDLKNKSSVYVLVER